MAGITIQATPVFKKLKEAYDQKKEFGKRKYRGYVLSGGSRSSKSWSIMQLLLVYCQENAYKNKNILVARQRYSDLKDTIMTDFFNMLEEYGLYREENHSRSHPQSYRYLGNTIHFRGLDAKGAHGEKRNVIWLNEAFEVDFDAFRQLNQRLTDFFIMDYNPCFTEHWILESVQTRSDVFYSHSTMLDNPFLEEEIRKEILAYNPLNPINVKNGTADDYMWQVYGLGIGASPEGVIFKYVDWIDEFPEQLPYSMGMDFGYTNDPTALVKVAVDGKDIYAMEMCYEPIDNPQAISEMLRGIEIPRSTLIIADSNDKYVSPIRGAMEMVKDLKQMGWNIKKVKKTQDIVYWINKLKEYRIHIVRTTNFKKEQEHYRWRTVNGIKVNQPIDRYNHLWDALRYNIMGASKLSRKRFWN
jgi:PBSX family phage terminase large subunit